jgi:hypothetical protein
MASDDSEGSHNTMGSRYGTVGTVVGGTAPAVHLDRIPVSGSPSDGDNR